MKDMDLNYTGATERDCAAAFVNATRKLYGDEEWADLTIECGARTFRVHRAVVCPRSEFFLAACKKDTFKEGKEDIIKLQSSNEAEDGDEPHIISILIEFLYHTTYDIMPEKAKLPPSAGNWDGPLAAEDRTGSTHAKVFAAAVKYGISSLKVIACHRFRSHLMRYWSIIQPIEDLIEAIHVTYTSTPDSVTDLRQCLLKQLSFMSKNVLADPKIKSAVSSYGALAYDLLLFIPEDHERVRQQWACACRERNASSPSSSL